MNMLEINICICNGDNVHNFYICHNFYIFLRENKDSLNKTLFYFTRNKVVFKIFINSEYVIFFTLFWVILILDKILR